MKAFLRTASVFLLGAVTGALTILLILHARDRLQPPRVSLASAEPPVSPSLARNVRAVVSPPVIPRPAAPPQIDSLAIPVAGVTVEQLQDTYEQARAAGRTHEAIDIMAARGTPVIASVDGTVRRLFNSAAGGITIYEFDPAGEYVYYYAHLDRYADGMQEGKVVRRGEVIGFVGSTGNASPSAPHLHFSVGKLPPTKEWWRGAPTNPYPLLKSRGVTYHVELDQSGVAPGPPGTYIKK